MSSSEQPGHSVRDLLSLSTDYLRNHGVPHARKEAEWLLAEALGCRRLDIYLSLENEPTEPQKEVMRGFLRKRAARIPRAYVLGYVEFMGLRIHVDPRVLVPRPETEILVEISRSLYPGERAVVMADTGTGSGAVAAALLDFYSKGRAIAVDISTDALDVARQNLDTLGFLDRAELVNTSFLPEGERDLDLVVANLPYLTEDEYKEVEPEVTHEPRQALVAGPTGLEMITELIDLAPSRLRPGAWIALETGHTHAPDVKNLLVQHGFSDIKCQEDYNGIPRVLTGRVSDDPA